MSAGVPKPQKPHRKMPRPAAFTHLPKGYCGMCAIPIYLPNGDLDRRRQFHPDCAIKWLIRSRQRVARLFVFERDKGQCAACATVHQVEADTWNLDHIRELTDAGGDPSYWEPSNCQILCREPCHRLKTDCEKAKRKETANVDQGRETSGTQTGEGSSGGRSPGTAQGEV